MSDVGEGKENNGENECSMEIDQVGLENTGEEMIVSVHKCLFAVQEVLQMILKKLKWSDLLNCADVCTLWREYTYSMIQKEFKFYYGLCIRVSTAEKGSGRRRPRSPVLNKTPTNPIQFLKPEYLSNFRLRYPDFSDADIENGIDLNINSILLKLTSEIFRENEIEFKCLKLKACKEMFKLTDSDTDFVNDVMEMVLLPWHREEPEEEAEKEVEVGGFNRKQFEEWATDYFRKKLEERAAATAAFNYAELEHALAVGINPQQQEVAAGVNHGHEPEEATIIPNEMNITKFLTIPLCTLNGIKLSGNAKSILPNLPKILGEISTSCKIIIKINLDNTGHYQGPSPNEVSAAHSWNLDNLVLMLHSEGGGHGRILDAIADILPNLQSLELCGDGIQQLVSSLVMRGRRLVQNLKKLTIHGNIYNVYSVFMESNVLPKLQELHITNGSVCCQDKQGSPHGPAIFKVLFNLKCLTHLSLPIIGHPKIGWWDNWLGPEYKTAWPWPLLENLKLSNGQCCGPPSADLDLLKLMCPNLHLEFGQCVNAKCNVSK